VYIKLMVANERPLREILAAVEQVLIPGAPMPATHSISVGSQGTWPAWLPLGLDTAARFGVPPGAVVPPGVDPVPGRARDPDDPPPNRPAVDAELVMEGDEPVATLGLVPMPRIEATDEGPAAPLGSGAPDAAPPVVVDVLGQRRPWVDPGPSDPHVVIEVRATEQGARWRPRQRSAPGDTAAGHGATLGQWLPLDVPPPDLATVDASWWSAGWDIGEALEPRVVAAAVVRAALWGVVLDGRDLPSDVRARISTELRDIMEEPLPPPEDPLAWELRANRQRRAAVRGHATSLVLDPVLRPDAAVPTMRPLVSALLVSRRPALAAAALRVLEHQTYPDLEIVVALHGVPPVPELEQAIAASRRPVELVNVPAEATLGEALGLATSRARGSFVTKVDDDDIYGMEHVWDLVVAQAVSGAMLVGKPSQFVLLDQQGVTIRRKRPAYDVYGHSIAGGTIFIARGVLESLGGWRPVRAGVDRALIDRVLQAGGTIYLAAPFGFIYRRHGEAHTWDVGDAYFLRHVRQQWDDFPDLAEFRQP
jgi:hypothetical protein